MMKSKIFGGLALATLLITSPLATDAATDRNIGIDTEKNPSISDSYNKQAPYVEGEVLVKFKEDMSMNMQQDVLSDINAEILVDENVVDSPFNVLKVKDVDQVVQTLSNNSQIEYVEPNYIMNATYTPNDPFFDISYQYGLFTTETTSAWDVTTGNSNQVVAVLDTGVDYNHEDLDDKTILGYNFVNNNNNPMDGNGHGTHVAGTAAAETNNGLGIAGVAPDTSILAVQVLDSSGSGSLANIVDGIIYAADYGAEVINLSLGCNCDTQAMEDAVDYAWDSGSVVVAAAGNSSTSTTFEPASYDNAIAVGAVDENNNIASFSNYGNWVDVTAPGVEIAGTYPSNRYVYLSGTSMASPHVAGLAALLASQGKDNSEIRRSIENTATPISGTGYYFQHGLINSFDAVNY